jgi:hypothetical protein
MGALVSNIDRLRQTSGAHVMLVHHSGKDGAKGARGHSLLRAATDTEIEVSRDLLTGTSAARVTKQRELETGDEWAFTLRAVELGANRRGKPVTSCVVSEADAPNRDRHLPRDQQHALAILESLIADEGRAGVEGIPEGVRCVPVSCWRERVYKRSKPDAQQGTKQRAFRRASDGLIEAGRVCCQGDWVWVP